MDYSSSFTVTSSGAGYQPTTDLPIGNNTITVTISDRAENMATATSNFTLVAELQASINATPTKGGIPLDVQFSALGDGGALPFTYEWDLNSDGSIDDTRENFNYVYQVYGIYMVTLTIKDALGNTASEQIRMAQ